MRAASCATAQRQIAEMSPKAMAGEFLVRRRFGETLTAEVFAIRAIIAILAYVLLLGPQAMQVSVQSPILWAFWAISVAPLHSVCPLLADLLRCK